MSAKLYEPCTLCDGSGQFRGGVTARFEPGDLARVAALAERGVCPGCEGRRFLPIGLTVGQVERLTSERAALRSLVERAVADRIDDEWLRAARAALRGLHTARTGGAA